jgi:hypothetical protein
MELCNHIVIITTIYAPHVDRNRTQKLKMSENKTHHENEITNLLIMFSFLFL